MPRSIPVLLALLLVACEPAAEPRGPGGGAPLAVGRPDTIVVGLTEEPPALWAPLTSSPSAALVRATLSAGLTERDEANLYQPRLAKRTPTIENGGARLVRGADGREAMVVTYEIRAGAKFSNGDPVTSEDVRFSWQLQLDPAVPALARGAAARYERIDTPDPSTVEVVYRPGVVDPLYYSFCCTIVSKAVFSAVPAMDLAASLLATRPVYAGPYRLKEWTPGTQIVVEADPVFWLGKPKTKTIVFRFVRDAAALLAELRAGRIDVATRDSLTMDSLPALEKLSADTDRQLRTIPASALEHLDFNLRDPRDLSRPHPALGDKRVREAIARAVDRDAIVAQIAPGKVTVAGSFLFGSSWAKAADTEIATYRPDAQAAARLLDEAGWRAGADGVRERLGTRLTLRLAYPTDDGARARIAQLVADQLRRVGILVRTEPLAPAALFASHGTGPLSAGAFDLALYAWAAGDDPQTFLYDCDQIPGR
ncbi:MAG: peptide ABC transporter substrate-binding protein, partial [Chloroflexi bacterium]|nr:peptide ABC transporter substrate-binding protein [Chloroflexota bacterium]